MDRLVQRNVLAMSGRAVEAAGDVNTLLLDKTGTITLGQPAGQPSSCRSAGVDRGRAGRRGAAVLAGRRDAGGPLDRGAGQERVRPARAARRASWPAREFVEFTAQTRMSGVDLADGRAGPQGRRQRGRASGSATNGGTPPDDLGPMVDGISGGRRHPAGGGRAGATAPPGRSASSTSRTSSRRACASGSTRCARWASGP